MNSVTVLHDFPEKTFRPFNRRSPFFIGMTAAAGVAVTYAAVQAILGAQSVLILIGLAMFLAIGLEPAVAKSTLSSPPRPSRQCSRRLTITAVLAGFLLAAVPALIDQGTTLIHNIPVYAQQLHDHHSWLGRINDQFHLQTKLSALLNSSDSTVVTGVLGVGAVVFGAITNTLIVLVLTGIICLGIKVSAQVNLVAVLLHRRCLLSLAPCMKTVHRVSDSALARL